MKERPILFSGPMVRAILAGEKTQTRRIVKPQPDAQLFSINSGPEWTYPDRLDPDEPDWDRVRLCPYGQPGDRLWVREAWHLWGPPERQYVDYRATCPDADQLSWKPSIHMPRAYSRISLEVTAVRVERVQDISEADAKAEGVHGIARTLPYSGDDLASVAFSGLWQEVNGKRYPWESNPWVWAVEFKRI